MVKLKLLKGSISESIICKVRKRYFLIVSLIRWNLRNRFQTTKTINHWACVMVSSQKPNQNQLAVAKQFVDLFPSVNYLEFL
jgi:hypothetical protein